MATRCTDPDARTLPAFIASSARSIPRSMKIEVSADSPRLRNTVNLSVRSAEGSRIVEDRTEPPTTCVRSSRYRRNCIRPASVFTSMPFRSMRRLANCSRSLLPGATTAAAKSSTRGRSARRPSAGLVARAARSRSEARGARVNAVPKSRRWMIESSSPASTRARIAALRRDTHAGQSASISDALRPLRSGGTRLARRASRIGLTSEYVTFVVADWPRGTTGVVTRSKPSRTAERVGRKTERVFMNRRDRADVLRGPGSMPGPLRGTRQRM